MQQEIHFVNRLRVVYFTFYMPLHKVFYMVKAMRIHSRSTMGLKVAINHLWKAGYLHHIRRSQFSERTYFYTPSQIYLKLISIHRQSQFTASVSYNPRQKCWDKLSKTSTGEIIIPLSAPHSPVQCCSSPRCSETSTLIRGAGFVPCTFVEDCLKPVQRYRRIQTLDVSALRRGGCRFIFQVSVRK